MKFSTPTYISIPPIPPLVDIKDVSNQGMLLPPDEIARVLALHLPNGHHHKADTNCKYNLLVKDGEYYAIYYGSKHNKILGEGSCGSVKLAQNLLTGEWVVKKLIQATIKEEACTEVTYLKELGMLTATSSTHQHYFFNRSRRHGITKYESDHISEFLLEYIPGMQLSELLERKEFFPSIFKINLAIGLVKQLKNLHQHMIRHGDIHDGNVMFDDKKQELRLIDFGCANKLETFQHDISNLCSNIFYLTKIDLASKLKSAGIDLYVVKTQPILDSMLALLETQKNLAMTQQEHMNIGVIDLNQYQENFPNNLMELSLIKQLKKYTYVVLVDSGNEKNTSYYALASQMLALNNVLVYNKVITNTSFFQLKFTDALPKLMQQKHPEYAYQFRDAATNELITQCDTSAKIMGSRYIVNQIDRLISRQTL